MPLSKPIEIIKQELQGQLVEDIAAALKSLQNMLPPPSEKQALVLALLGRLNDANKARLRNTLSNDDLQREYDKIRADFFDLIQDLQEADFDASASAAAGPEGQAAPKRGSILYRIPGTMPKDIETKCVVRIALSEDAIVENITIDEHVQLKELYKVSDTMQAELLDPGGGRVFRINTISEPVQIIDEQGYTEWWFYVTPLLEGVHPLVLKVSIIELVNGQPHPKELVMEERVQIVTEGPVSEEGQGDLKAAGFGLSFQSTATAGAGLVMAVPEKKAAAPAKAAGHILQRASMAMVVLVAGIGAAWAFTPGHVRDWLAARYLSDTPEQYQAFMNKHPDSKYYEPAAYRKAELEDTPAAYRDYLYEFTDAKFRAAATDALTRLEQKALGDLEQNPTLPGLRTFLVDFPETGNLNRLLPIVQKNETLRKIYLPVILHQMEEGRRLKPLTQLADSLRLTGLPVPALTPTPQTGKKPEDPPQAEETPAPVTTTTAPRPIAPAPQGPAVSAPAVPAPAPAGNVQPPKMATVKGGTFQMGSADGVKDEQPVHQVTLQDFQVGTYEVTFAEYDKFCASTDRTPPADESWGRGQLPVIHVSWLDAVAYCNWLSTQVGLKPAYTFAPNGAISLDRQSKGYRLPTEAEWEFAAKGGPSQPAYVFSGSDELDEVAWHSGNSRNRTHPVGHKKPNDLGLYDLTGNVREWCHDGYGRYAASTVENPLGAGITDSRVIRGGMWGRNPLQQRNTYRNFAKPDYKDYGTGFRVARWR